MSKVREHFEGIDRNIDVQQNKIRQQRLKFGRYGIPYTESACNEGFWDVHVQALVRKVVWQVNRQMFTCWTLFQPQACVHVSNIKSEEGSLFTKYWPQGGGGGGCPKTFTTWPIANSFCKIYNLTRTSVYYSWWCHHINWRRVEFMLSKFQ